MNSIVYTQAGRQAQIRTPLGGDRLMLIRAEGVESLSKPFEYTAALFSDEDSIEGASLIGQPVSISFRSEGGATRYIHGLVSHFRYTGTLPDGVDYSGYQAKIVPWFWFLKNNRDCRIFQEQNVQQIIEKVFRKLGFKDYEFRLSEKYSEREYCVQYNETDFDFVSRLMEEEGIFYFFQHAAGQHRMILADSEAAYFELPDSQVDAVGKEQSQFRQIIEWNHSYEFRPGRIAQRDFNFKKPTDKLEAKEETQTPYSMKERFEVFEYPGKYFEGSAGKRFAKVRREQSDVRHELVQGKGSYPSFSPGGLFTVKDSKRSSDRGKSFVLTSVKTAISAGFDFDNARSRAASEALKKVLDTMELTYRSALEQLLKEGKSEGSLGETPLVLANEFECIPATNVFRPERVTPKPVADGPQTAIVVTDGDEIAVDEHARVKVQFHWDRQGKQNSKSSCWIRVSQTHAGKGWGVIDIPRKGEEVIVSFLDGDPDRPIITGRVYNGDNQPPFGLKGPGDNSKNKTRRGNTTRTYNGSGYNEMTMDDTPGQEEIRIHGQYDMNTSINNNETHKIGMDRTKDIGQNETMTIGQNQDLKVGVNKSVTVGADHNETINANQTVQVGANQSISVAADQSTKVGANQSTEVAANQSNKVGSMKSETVGMVSNESVGAIKTTNVGAVYSIISGAAMNTAVGFVSAEEVGLTKTIMVGSNLKITVGSKIEITCGASKLTMDSGGKVTISGTQFNFSASGNVKINGAVIDLN